MADWRRQSVALDRGDARHTVHQIEPGRGYAEAAKLLGEGFEGVRCVDGWAPYRGFDHAQIQTCLAHLLRRSKELREAPPTAACAVYFGKISAVLQEALALRNRRDEAAGPQ
jgi:hypothetical protein